MKDTKICKKCNKELSFDNFWKQPNNKDGYFGKCKTCALILVGDNAINKQPFLDKNIWICTSCKENLELTHENFHLDCTTSTKFKAKCKKCTNKSRLNLTRMIDKDSLDYFLKEVFSAAKGRAVKKKLEFNISLEFLKNLWMKQAGKCAITGLSMSHTVLSGRLKNNLSIDRINSNEGYITNNIQFVCTSVNIMKSTLTMNELKYYCNLILQHNE